jgi:polar amino acid transport system substrate-binding protein
MRAVALAGVVAMALAACAGAAAPSADPAADPTRDKLAQVLDRGTLVLWTDLEYPPQSFAVEGASRKADTKCAPNEKTGPEVSGYDAETGKAVAATLGVEPCFVATPFDSMIAGAWGDRFDVAWASGAITTERLKSLYATQPYYSTPATFFVPEDSTIADPRDLSGKTIGVCSGCTHERYLTRKLELPGESIEWLVDDPKIETYSTEPPGLQDLADHKLEAFLCSEPVGLGAIADGLPVRPLEEDAYFTQKTGYVDRDLTLAAEPFVDAINDAVAELHASGKLAELSNQFFKQDYTEPAAAFDMAALHQTVR